MAFCLAKASLFKAEVSAVRAGGDEHIVTHRGACGKNWEKGFAQVTVNMRGDHDDDGGRQRRARGDQRG